MDYSKIVLEGYCNENSKEFLDQYFLREFRKAEKEHLFGASEFFSGCTKVAKGWEHELKQQINKYKTQAGEYKKQMYSELNNAKTLEKVKYCEREIKSIIQDGQGTFTMPLRSLTTGRTCQIGFNEINQIRIAIVQAWTKTIDIDTLPTEQKTEPKPKASKALPPEPISIKENRIKKVISETLTDIDRQGWQYAFGSEQDFNRFADLLTNFFECKPYTLPKTTIQLKRSCKTKVAKALGEIHAELSNGNKLSTDTKYFQLIRVLNHFEKEKKGDLYKALTR